MPQHRKHPTDADRQRAYRQRRAQAESQEWEAMQAVVTAAALLAQAHGLPYETHGQLAESLRHLRETIQVHRHDL